MATVDGSEVIVREFSAESDALRPLGGTVARSLAETLLSRGILAPLATTGEAPPVGVRALVVGRISSPARGTLDATARLIDLERHRVVDERRFREYSNPFFGEDHALHRDAIELGREIADWVSVRED